MEEFLIKDLGVPEGHIQCLLSPIPIPSPDPSNNSRRIDPEERRIVGAVTSPIRKNIIDTLLGLSTDSQILHGDNIIIYFSGHGSSYDLSDFDKSGDISAEGFIEALCPVDRTSSDTDVSIPDISDREINTILAEISRKKGNHITFILDCCHSSGASRNPSQPLNVVRRAPSLPATSIQDMLDAAHTRLKNLPKYRSVFKGNWKPDMTSHVVLAACEAFQYALEKEGADNRCNGIFTQALIKVLKSDSSKELESTYVDLIGALKMPQNSQQTPVVAGNMNARLWYQPEMNKKVSPPQEPIAPGAWWSAMLLSGVGVGVAPQKCGKI
ncbi:uncharacterized protein ARMOST_16065 [Armillaria ostoyae]|uniref:Peptidase C14 caspase domain-containing protein n=1 Tax=Armillaria ostoyae TaxID=47428 RepID=A0A284RV43_ARMOS|nr:uncharacterized protein ARMOST_16065 [Armillaria ostoyae]